MLPILLLLFTTSAPAIAQTPIPDWRPPTHLGQESGAPVKPANPPGQVPRGKKDALPRAGKHTFPRLIVEDQLGDCTYKTRTNTGGTICQLDVRQGETFFYWDDNNDGRAERIKHAFHLRTADNRIIKWAVFSWLTQGGKLMGQAWTSKSHDDWTMRANDYDGDGFFESFCLYQGGSCVAMQACDMKVVQHNHREMAGFYDRVRQTQSPLEMSYAHEIYSRADRWLNFCTSMESKRGPER